MCVRVCPCVITTLEIGVKFQFTFWICRRPNETGMKTVSGYREEFFVFFCSHQFNILRNFSITSMEHYLDLAPYHLFNDWFSIFRNIKSAKFRVSSNFRQNQFPLSLPNLPSIKVCGFHHLCVHSSIYENSIYEEFSNKIHFFPVYNLVPYMTWLWKLIPGKNNPTVCQYNIHPIYNMPVVLREFYIRFNLSCAVINKWLSPGNMLCEYI